MDAVTDMWKEIDAEKVKMMKEVQELRVRVDKERMARQQLQLQLEQAEQEVQ